MLLYLLTADELYALFDRLGYRLDPDPIPKTVKYYLPVPHMARPQRGGARVGARPIRPPRSWRFFLEALDSDLHDVQGGTTSEGIHLGAMAGTLDLAQRCYTGLETRDDVHLVRSSHSPRRLVSLTLDVRYRRRWVNVST